MQFAYYENIMKKIVLGTAGFLGFVTSATTAFAEDINISPREGFIGANVSLSQIFNNALQIVFSAAALLVFIFLIIGAFQWIASGGDKEAVGKARGRITAALVGLLILALSFVIIRLVGNIVGVDLTNFKFPSLSQ